MAFRLGPRASQSDDIVGSPDVTLGLPQPWRHGGDAVNAAALPARHHQQLVDMLEVAVRASDAELVERQPRDPNYDIAWRISGVTTVVEVKTTTPVNEVDQLRLGLGQLLEYGCLLRRQGHQRVRRVLFVSSKPAASHWQEVLAQVGCELAWPPMHEDDTFIVGQGRSRQRRPPPTSWLRSSK